MLDYYNRYYCIACNSYNDGCLLAMIVCKGCNNGCLPAMAVIMVAYLQWL